MWIPFAGAVAFALLLPLLAGKADPVHLAEKLDGVIGSEQIARFRLVWWIHSGLYAGMLLGLGVMAARQKHW